MHQICDRQRREWVEKNIPEHQWRFRPILPILFYTGKTPWEMPLAISALMNLPRELELFVPHHQTLFFNLKETPLQNISEIDQLNTLLDLFVTANSSEEISIE